jgi:small nuclear ribonucleoprotein (snRNP)-like protein
MPPRKKRPFLMYVVLQSLLGQPVCLELKNDDEVHGSIESVDRDMNISLVNVTYVFAKVCNARCIYATA